MIKSRDSIYKKIRITYGRKRNMSKYRCIKLWIKNKKKEKEYDFYHVYIIIAH